MLDSFHSLFVLSLCQEVILGPFSREVCLCCHLSRRPSPDSSPGQTHLFDPSISLHHILISREVTSDSSDSDSVIFSFSYFPTAPAERWKRPALSGSSAALDESEAAADELTCHWLSASDPDELELMRCRSL